MISTHAPRTGSDAAAAEKAGVTIEISTHAPRTGSDQSQPAAARAASNFNPRSPHGERRPPRPALAIPTKKFQPTLPARGATAGGWLAAGGAGDFNPRSPHGERHYARLAYGRMESIISTHAPRTGSDEATLNAKQEWFLISTHAPRTGSDCRVGESTYVDADFNPRSPHGERHRAGRYNPGRNGISTHAPRTGSDAGSAGGR